MTDNIIFVITGADIIPSINPILRRERYIEYRMSLNKIFNYGYHAYGVLSECDNTDKVDRPPFSLFPFKHLEILDKGLLPYNMKSRCENMSISKLLDNMKNFNISDDTFIIKISGRYLLLDDTFINTVRDNINKHTSAIIYSSNTSMFTFLYALRYKYFKKFYKSNIEDGSVEYVLYKWLSNNDLLDTTLSIKRLGVLTNISNGNTFQVI